MDATGFEQLGRFLDGLPFGAGPHFPFAGDVGRDEQAGGVTAVWILSRHHRGCADASVCGTNERGANLAVVPRSAYAVDKGFNDHDTRIAAFKVGVRLSERRLETTRTLAITGRVPIGPIEAEIVVRIVGRLGRDGFDVPRLLSSHGVTQQNTQFRHSSTFCNLLLCYFPSTLPLAVYPQLDTGR